MVLHTPISFWVQQLHLDCRSNPNAAKFFLVCRRVFVVHGVVLLSVIFTLRCGRRPDKLRPPRKLIPDGTVCSTDTRRVYTDSLRTCC